MDYGAGGVEHSHLRGEIIFLQEGEGAASVYRVSPNIRPAGRVVRSTPALPVRGPAAASFRPSRPFLRESPFAYGHGHRRLDRTGCSCRAGGKVPRQRVERRGAPDVLSPVAWRDGPSATGCTWCGGEAAIVGGPGSGPASGLPECSLGRTRGRPPQWRCRLRRGHALAHSQCCTHDATVTCRYSALWCAARGVAARGRTACCPGAQPLRMVLGPAAVLRCCLTMTDGLRETRRAACQFN